MFRILSDPNNTFKIMIEAFKIIIKKELPHWTFVKDDNTYYSTSDNEIPHVLSVFPLPLQVELLSVIMKIDLRTGMKFLSQYFVHIPETTRNDILQ